MAIVSESMILFEMKLVVQEQSLVVLGTLVQQVVFQRVDVQTFSCRVVLNSKQRVLVRFFDGYGVVPREVLCLHCAIRQFRSHPSILVHSSLRDL